MSRPRLAVSLALAATAALVALPAAADRSYHSRLDDEGRSFGAAWSDTPRFDAITAAGMDDVTMRSGDRWRIRATGDPRAIAQLRYIVDRNALVLGRVSGQRERYGKAGIEITVPALRAVTAAGSGAVDVERLGGERASATVAGAGKATIRAVHTERLTATLAGSGGLSLAGRSERADITIAGAGGLSGAEFTTGSANVTIAGAGSARVRSPGAIRATIVGSGTISVSGTTACSQTRLGSGRLECTA